MGPEIFQRKRRQKQAATGLASRKNYAREKPELLLFIKNFRASGL
jgi:hypothetical protein